MIISFEFTSSDKFIHTVPQEEMGNDIYGPVNQSYAIMPVVYE